jgi:hypothetical protein
MSLLFFVLCVLFLLFFCLDWGLFLLLCGLGWDLVLGRCGLDGLVRIVESRRVVDHLLAVLKLGVIQLLIIIECI